MHKWAGLVTRNKISKRVGIGYSEISLISAQSLFFLISAVWAVTVTQSTWMGLNGNVHHVPSSTKPLVSSA